MTASYTKNKEAGRAALWWLYKEATFIATLMDTSGASSPPALTAPIEDWQVPTDYSLGMGWQVFVTGATTVAYDATLTDRAVIAQVDFAIDFSMMGFGGHFDYTFTDLVVTCQPDLVSSRPSGSPGYTAQWTVGVIHESSARTLNTSNTSESYKLDLFAESA